MRRKLTDNEVEAAARQAASHLPRLWSELQEWERANYRADVCHWFAIFQSAEVIDVPKK